jgi:hypothetical protein
MGHQEALAGTLKTAEKSLAASPSLYITRSGHKQYNWPWFSNVVDQLSVAVANILANEEILQREREKSRCFLFPSNWLHSR